VTQSWIAQLTEMIVLSEERLNRNHSSIAVSKEVALRLRRVTLGGTIWVSFSMVGRASAWKLGRD